LLRGINIEAEICKTSPADVDGLWIGRDERDGREEQGRRLEAKGWNNFEGSYSKPIETDDQQSLM